MKIIFHKYAAAEMQHWGSNIFGIQKITLYSLLAHVCLDSTLIDSINMFPNRELCVGQNSPEFTVLSALLHHQYPSSILPPGGMDENFPGNPLHNTDQSLPGICVPFFIHIMLRNVDLQSWDSFHNSEFAKHLVEQPIVL